jgi:predicted nucleic acid-binding protein
VLVVSERRGRLGAGKSNRALGILRRLPIEFDGGMDEDGILGLARAHRLAVYDAAYLELARRENMPLATLDAALAEAARAEGAALTGQGAG